MRTVVLLSVALATLAGPAAAQAGYGTFSPHKRPNGFQQPPVYHPPATPNYGVPAQPAYKPPPVRRAYDPVVGDSTFKPFKPFTGSSIYSDRGGLDSYPQPPKRRRPGF